MTVTRHSAPRPSLDNENKLVVALHQEPCRVIGTHVQCVRLEDGGEITCEDVMVLMDLGKRFFMIPPPGAPAFAAHQATGLCLLLQTRSCPSCGDRVLFA